MKRSTIAILIAVLALAVAACGGGGESDGGTAATAGGGVALTGDVANGEKVFAGTCSACHGADAMGIDGLGKQLAGSDFVASTSDADLANLILTGRPSSHPDNETGVDMPPKGGNPSLNDQSIADVVAYIKSLG